MTEGQIMIKIKDYSHLPEEAQYMVVEISESCKSEVEMGRLKRGDIVEAFKVLLDTWEVQVL